MQKRIIILTLISVAVILVSLGVMSSLSIHNSIRRSLSNRLELATIIANYSDALLQGNLTRLYDISLSGAVDFKDGDWGPEKKALETAYQYSVFTDGTFLLDKNGDIVAAYPPGRQKENLLDIPYVRMALEKQEAVVSDVYSFPRTKRNVIFVLVPLKDRAGNVVGLAGGEINPTGYILNRIMRAVPTRADTYIELVDSQGTVIASNNPTRLFSCTDHDKFLGNLIEQKKSSVTTCHRCHVEGNDNKDTHRITEMLAFAPIGGAPWGVLVSEPEEQVFAPSSSLKKMFFLIAVISMFSALALAFGMTSGIVKPVKSLIAATRKIAEGDLREPVALASKDEIGLLGKSFEAMRVRLSESLDGVRRANEDLERRVAERTAELLQNRKRLAILLHEVLTAQEEERKRIARELHDETSQSLAALGMSVEVAELALKDEKLSPEMMHGLRAKLNEVIDGINMLIRGLRPPVLDDLGLESAIRWLLERHLGEKGIDFKLASTLEFKEAVSSIRTSSEGTELMLFRVIQEAVVNVAKHAQASSVSVFLDFRSPNIHAVIDDDGVGFDAPSVLGASDVGAATGFGLLGMKERLALMEGKLLICSAKGYGTQISFECPIDAVQEV